MLRTLKWVGYILLSVVALCMVAGVGILVAIVVTFGGIFFAVVIAVILIAFLISEAFESRRKPAD